MEKKINKIAKKCYEERFSTQKYKDSILHNTFASVMDRIVEETKKESNKEIKNIKEDIIAELENDNTKEDVIKTLVYHLNSLIIS